GDDVTATTQGTTTRVSNYTQIARKVVVMSRTAQDVNVVGKQGTFGREMMKKMKEYKRDVEFDLLGRQGSSAGATNTAAASGGVCAWIFGVSQAVTGLNGNTVAATS